MKSKQKTFLEKEDDLWLLRYNHIEEELNAKTTNQYAKMNFIKKWLRNRKKDIELDDSFNDLTDRQAKAIVKWSLSWDITLKDLEKLISNEIKDIGFEKTIEATTRAIEYLIGRGIHERFYKKLYTSAIRALGNSDLSEAIAFADKYVNKLYDERALKALITYCNRSKKNSKSLEYINYMMPNEWAKEQKKIVQKRMSYTENLFFENLDSIKTRRPEICVACILDEFSWENLRYECDLYPLSPVIAHPLV